MVEPFLASGILGTEPALMERLARAGAGGITSLTRADAAAIAELRDVVAVAPSVRSTAQVRYRGSNWGTAIEGVTADYATVQSWPLAAGDFISEQQVIAAATG